MVEGWDLKGEGRPKAAVYTRHAAWPGQKKLNPDLGSARAAKFAQTIFFCFLNGMARYLCQNNNNKCFHPRARNRFENGSDPNPYITALSTS